MGGYGFRVFGQCGCLGGAVVDGATIGKVAKEGLGVEVSGSALAAGMEGMEAVATADWATAWSNTDR